MSEIKLPYTDAQREAVARAIATTIHPPSAGADGIWQSFLPHADAALAALYQSVPRKNVLDTVEQYRREHPGVLERAQAEMIAEDAGIYPYTCPHCGVVFKALYGQNFPACPYCAKPLTWWPEVPQRIKQSNSAPSEKEIEEAACAAANRRIEESANDDPEYAHEFRCHVRGFIDGSEWERGRRTQQAQGDAQRVGKVKGCIDYLRRYDYTPGGRTR